MTKFYRKHVRLTRHDQHVYARKWHGTGYPSTRVRRAGSMFPPDTTATARPYRDGSARKAATPRTAHGSATRRARRTVVPSADRIASSVTVTRADTRGWRSGNVISPTSGVRPPSAIVRYVSAGSHPVRRPADRASRTPAASSGSTPTTRVDGDIAFTATP